MFDRDQRRVVSAEELRDRLIGGEYFLAETEETGRDCTYEVLSRLLGASAATTPGMPMGGAMSGLNAASSFGSLGMLEMARMLRDRSDGDDDRNHDRVHRRSARPRSRTEWASEVDEAAEAGTDEGGRP